MGRRSGAYVGLDITEYQTQSRDSSEDESSTTEACVEATHSSQEPSWELKGRKKKAWWQTTVLVVFLLLALASGLISSAVTMGSFTHTSTTPSQISLGTCGHSAQEAQEKGCVFDLFMGGFSHRQCFHQDLNDRYVRKYDLRFYSDIEGIEEMSREEVMTGDWVELWLNGTFHYAHCAYMWEKHLRALQSGNSVLAMDSRTRDAEHVIHCTDFIGRPNATYITGRSTSHIKQSWLIECIVGPIM